MRSSHNIYRYMTLFLTSFFPVAYSLPVIFVFFLDTGHIRQVLSSRALYLSFPHSETLPMHYRCSLPHFLLLICSTVTLLQRLSQITLYTIDTPKNPYPYYQESHNCISCMTYLLSFTPPQSETQDGKNLIFFVLCCGPCSENIT